MSSLYNYNMVENNSLLGAFIPTRPVDRPAYQPEQQPRQQPAQEDVGTATGRIARTTASAPLNFLPDDRSLEFSIEQAKISQQQGKPVERGSIINLIL